MINTLVIGLSLAPLFVQVLALGLTRRQLRSAGSSVPVMVFAVVFLLNVSLLVGFVWPLIQPLGEPQYLADIRTALERGDSKRAAALARVATTAYPVSTDLGRLAVVSMQAAEQTPELRAFLRQRITASHAWQRTEAVALARLVRSGGWSDNSALELATAQLSGDARFREESLLLRLAINGNGATDVATSASWLTEAGIDRQPATLEGRAAIEGHTVHGAPNGRSEVVIFFRPLGSWKDKQLWFHAYPEGSREYVDVAARLAAFPDWRPGELAWEVFETPKAGRFNVYVGVALGDDLGPAHPLGMIGSSW